MTNEAWIRAYYRALAEAWGPQHWWPAHTRFEVIAGAFLTQNTAWTNVERALANLRAARCLSLDGIRHTPLAELEQRVRPAGYFRQKAQRLKTFVAFLDARYEGSLARMFARPTTDLRQELLGLNGVGPETADSILLYAGDHPVFVVDAYTRRIVERHGLLPPETGYEEIRTLFECALSSDGVHARGDQPYAKPETPANRALSAVGKLAQDGSLPGAAHPPSPVSATKRSDLAQRYNEMHALIVGAGKRYCAKREPQCRHCPLQCFLSPSQTTRDSSCGKCAPGVER